jgi:hypothetical protein
MMILESFILEKPFSLWPIEMSPMGKLIVPVEPKISDGTIEPIEICWDAQRKDSFISQDICTISKQTKWLNIFQMKYLITTLSMASRITAE